MILVFVVTLFQYHFERVGIDVQCVGADLPRYENDTYCCPAYIYIGFAAITPLLILLGHTALLYRNADGKAIHQDTFDGYLNAK